VSLVPRLRLGTHCSRGFASSAVRRSLSCSACPGRAWARGDDQVRLTVQNGGCGTAPPTMPRLNPVVEQSGGRSTTRVQGRSLSFPGSALGRTAVEALPLRSYGGACHPARSQAEPGHEGRAANQCGRSGTELRRAANKLRTMGTQLRTMGNEFGRAGTEFPPIETHFLPARHDFLPFCWDCLRPPKAGGESRWPKTLSQRTTMIS